MQVPHSPVAVADEKLFPRLDESLGHLIRRTQQLQNLLWSALVDSHVTGAQYAILSVVAAYPGARRSLIEDLAALDRSTSADVIARLQANNWIERERADHDARQSQLSLTPPTRVALPVISQQVCAVQERLLAPLDERDRGELERLLAVVAYADASELRRHVPIDSTVQIMNLATAPFHLLRRAEQRHQRLWSQLVGSLATPTQYAVLCALGPEALDQKTVSSLASLDTSTAADVISRLRRQAVVQVTPDERDRRRNLVQLTPAAFDLVADLTPCANAVHRALCSPLSTKETAQLKGLLRTISFGPDGDLSHM